MTATKAIEMSHSSKKTPAASKGETAGAATGRRRKGAASKALILDTAEMLMLEEGYAAVSSRRVAMEAGLKAPLVHYYFPTTDDLFLAVYRRAVEKELNKQQETLDEPPSLRSLWDSYCNQEQTRLAMEFIALANHRKTIRDEIASLTEQTRQRRAEALSRMLDREAERTDELSTAGLTVLLIGVARTLVMEEGMGISLGHADARRFIERWLEQLEGPSGQD